MKKMTFDKYFDCFPTSVVQANYPHIDAETHPDWSSILKPGFTANGNMSHNFWLKTRERGKSYYINAQPFTFDIETTNYEDDATGDIAGFMYHWACTYQGKYITGRRWSTFIEFYEAVVATSGCGVRTIKEKDVTFKLLCCVHNFSFEWQFLKHRLTFVANDFFAKDTRNIVYAGTVDGVRFVDTYSISGVSLKKLSELANLPTKKADGDLDYSKPRNSMTPLINNEPLYVQNDVYVLDEYYQYLIGTYVTWGLPIPITMTQKLRHDVKVESRKYFVKPDGHVNEAAVDWLLSLFPNTIDELNDLYTFLFKGGYTHANALHVGKPLKNVFGIDFTSSYPAVMMQSYNYPVSSFEYEPSYIGRNNTSILTSDHCVIAKIHFHEIRQKTHISTESKTKSYEWAASAKPVDEYDCRSQLRRFLDMTGFIEDNGRMVYAEDITFAVTELDMKVINEFYEFEYFDVLDAKIAQKGRLPAYLRDEIIKPYKAKCEIKESDPNHDYNPLYHNAKGTVNGGYGMTVEKPHYVEVVLGDEAYEVSTREETETEEEYLNKILHGPNWEKVLKYHSAPTKVLSPFWGVYITAIARFRLLCGLEDGSYKGAVLVMADDTVYCDTDSIYYVNWKKYEDWLNGWNERLAELNNEWVNEYNNTHKSYPLNNKQFESLGGFDPIGKNAKDKSFSHFKTLGAKRYLKMDGEKLVPTVAGCPKKAILDITKDMSIEEKFEFFADGMTVPACKKGHVYHDQKVTATIEDEFGNVEEMEELSSIGISTINFKMSMTDDFIALVKNILESEGVNYG